MFLPKISRSHIDVVVILFMMTTGWAFYTLGSKIDVVISQNALQAEALTRVERQLEENKTLVALNNNGCVKGAGKFAHYMTTPVRVLENTAFTDICGAVTEDLNDGNESCRELYLDCSVQWCEQQDNPPELGCRGLVSHVPRHVFPPTLLASTRAAL